MWLFFALLTAFFEACKDATGKQSLKSLDEYSVIFGFTSVGVIFLFPLLWLSGMPLIQPNFWWALLIGGSLNILAFILYIKAIKLADLSLTVPLVTLTPLFLLVTSPLLVQEWPTQADAVGVVLLVVGSYVLNLRTPVGSAALRDRPWTPLVAMIRNPGSRLMLGVALIWSITSNFDKIGVLNSSPLCWAIALFAVIAAGMVPFVFGQGRHRAGWVPLCAHWRILAITGGFNAIAIAFQMLALPMAPVTQVIAVKRLSTLLSVIFGHFFFGEKGLKERLIGAAIMVSGVVIMSLR
jgi:uncharacterized membrane protein